MMISLDSQHSGRVLPSLELGRLARSSCCDRSVSAFCWDPVQLRLGRREALGERC